MKIKIYKNLVYIASSITKSLEDNKICVIGLPTGNTPIFLYKNIVSSKTFLKSKTFFMLDCLYPQKPEDTYSYYSFIRKNLLDHIAFKKNNFHILNSDAKDPDTECRNYEMAIKSSGGIDLAILGIGQNGHIAFNEPGTPEDSVTHMVKLSDQTRIANGGLDNIPEYGLTMGIKTIMSARKIFLLAKGKNKAKAVYDAVKGPISSDCPASFLQKHPDCTFFLDADAASLL